MRMACSDMCVRITLSPVWLNIAADAVSCQAACWPVRIKHRERESGSTDGGTIHGRPLCLSRRVIGVLPVGHEEDLVPGRHIKQ